MKRTLLLHAALWVASAVPLLAAEAAQPQPNIVFILADDLGWADVGFNVLRAGQRVGLSLNERLLPQALREAG